MKSIKKILVPTDFSDNAELAYTHAQEIAHRFGAKVDVIHIIPTLKYFNESMDQLEAPLDNVDKELYPTAQKEVEHRLQTAMDDYLADESKGEPIVRIDRKPWEVVAELAQDDGYDLIVMPSKGRHQSKLLRGSTTEKVIRHSQVPVFTVDERISSEGLKHILVPTDGSDISFSALPLAISLADIYDAGITLYHVQELYGSPLESAIHDPNKDEETNIYEALIGHLEDYLASEESGDIKIARGEADFEDQFVITDGASSHRIDVYSVIEKGVSAHAGIQEYAAENADAVVMATHGHSGLAHFFLGSTTEKVAQSIDKPVLTIKPDSSKFEES